MFANVANMKNLFFENPNDADIKEIGEIFYLHDAIIPIDSSDIKRCWKVLVMQLSFMAKLQDIIVAQMLSRMQYYIHVLLQKIMTFFC